MRKREVAGCFTLIVSPVSCDTVGILLLFLMVSCVGLQRVIVVFYGPTLLPFVQYIKKVICISFACLSGLS